MPDEKFVPDHVLVWKLGGKSGFVKPQNAYNPD